VELVILGSTACDPKIKIKIRKFNLIQLQKHEMPKLENSYLSKILGKKLD